MKNILCLNSCKFIHNVNIILNMPYLSGAMAGKDRREAGDKCLLG